MLYSSVRTKLNKRIAVQDVVYSVAVVFRSNEFQVQSTFGGPIKTGAPMPYLQQLIGKYLQTYDSRDSIPYCGLF